MWEAIGAVHEHLRQVTPGDGKRNSVRNRLRSRLVQRRTSELVAALVRRHGDSWSAHVLQGGFHADESMRRICEAFGLRPDLERQVLQAASERARSLTSNANETKAQSADSNCGAPPVFGTTSDDEVSQSTQEPSRQLDLESSDAGYPSSAEFSPATSSAASPTLGPMEDSENDDAESLGWTLEEVSPADVPAACRAAPQIWRAPWRMRVLSTLGLDRWWSSPRIGALSTPEELVGLTEVQQVMLEEAGIAEGVENEDSEDMLLSSKLVAAVLNAERQAGSNCEGHDGNSEPDEAHKLQSHACQLPHSRRLQSNGPRGVVHFAESSNVCFFGSCPERSQPVDGYQRSLVTKVFDGPSGHKAKRAREADPDASDADGTATEEEDDEDWEDRCDDIADLMNQQRSMLLWSDSW